MSTLLPASPSRFSLPTLRSERPFGKEKTCFKTSCILFAYLFLFFLPSRKVELGSFHSSDPKSIPKQADSDCPLVRPRKKRPVGLSVEKGRSPASALCFPASRPLAEDNCNRVPRRRRRLLGQLDADVCVRKVAKSPTWRTQLLKSQALNRRNPLCHAKGRLAKWQSRKPEGKVTSGILVISF